jgi:hypothetical protein
MKVGFDLRKRRRNGFEQIDLILYSLREPLVNI